MLPFLTVLIALISLLLMAAILIQNPKGGGIDSTFGGGQAQQLFGASQSADFIEKATWWLVGILLGLCVFTAIIASGGTVQGSEVPLM